MSKVFNIVVKGNDTPTTTLTVDGELSIGLASEFHKWSIPIQESKKNEIESSLTPFVINGTITHQSLGNLNYKINCLAYIALTIDSTVISTYSGVCEVEIKGKSQKLPVIIICREDMLEIIIGG